MSWGVATQNGVSVSLASIVSLSCGATEFSPASLFTSGVAGAWYDPSDTSTLFQDSAGTTPVTAVEQPVGLMLDKSQGLVLGSEIISVAADRDFSSNTGYWSFNSGVGISGGSMNWSATPDTYAGYTTSNSITTPGKYYEVTWTLSSISSGGIKAGAGAQYAVARTVAGTYTDRILAASAANRISFVCVGTTTASIDNVSVKEVAGNHASQATSASRPILRARYNLLTYSEQFDNAAWGKTNVTIGSTPVLAPDGTTTADLFYPSSTGSNRWINSSSAFAAAIYTYSIRAKYSGIRWLYILKSDGSAGAAWFDVQNGVVGTVAAGYTASIATAPNGFYVCTVTTPSTTPNFLTYTGLSSADNSLNVTANGTDGIYIWGADLRTGSSAGTYQRIAAATDYATAGFLPYLALDGTDDSFGTNSIDFSATDAMSVCVGVTKLSDSSAQMIAELSATLNTNNGTFYLLGPDSVSGNNYTYASKGTTSTTASASATSPVTNVITAQSKISTPLASMRKDGAASGSSSATQGTGNFGNYALFIGRRNNSTFPFNGRIYQMVVCGKTLSASELASTEAYVATKTGVVI